MTQSATASNEWFKSSLSFANGNCVEVQFLTTGEVQVRNSRDHSQGMLTFTHEEWTSFIGGCNLGEFDLLPLASDVEQAALRDPAVMAAVQEARRHPEDRTPYRRRSLPLAQTPSDSDG